MDLVDVCLFGGEVDVFADLVADIAEEGVVDEVLDYSMLVAVQLVSRIHLIRMRLVHTVLTLHNKSCIPRVPCHRISRRGSSCAPRGPLQWWLSSVVASSPASLPRRVQHLGFCAFSSF
jgi:hypothetical protein